MIAVVVGNGGAGGETAPPIASLMAEKYLTGEISDSRKACKCNSTKEYHKLG